MLTRKPYKNSGLISRTVFFNRTIQSIQFPGNMRNTSLILLSVVVALFLLGILTSVEGCKGKPATPQCEGPLDGGHKRLRRCKKTYNKAMWHFNVVTNNCTQFKYKGCAGNNNRWCSKLICETCRVQLFK